LRQCRGLADRRCCADHLEDQHRNGHGEHDPEAGAVRMVGNLLGDPAQEVPIGAAVEAVFEPHDDATPPFTLVQWRRTP